MSAVVSKKGERAYKRESYKTAELHFRHALRLMPSNLHALSGLGWTLYDSGRSGEAFLVFQRAQELYPEDGSTRRGLAYLFYRYGQIEKARKLLGSLDKEKWPELANIDSQLQTRAAKGFPPPKPPLKNLLSAIPEIIKGVIPTNLAKKSELVEKEKPRRALKQKANSKIGSSPARGKKKNIGRIAQHPTFHNMVLIPRGVAAKRGSNKIEVRSFRIDKFEVTNAFFAAFVQETSGVEPPFWNKPRFSGPHLPVVGVTWNEAREYCKWAGKRLPSEAEWELAARGDAGRRRYPWGNKFVNRNVVFGLQPDRGGPRAVGRRPGGASVYGVEDLSGNVWEWVEDPFRPKRPRNSGPVIRDGIALRTLRGGSWVNSRRAMTVESRTGDDPRRRLPVYGFRCVADTP